VGVPCAGCGREYDVTLFEFGRTIHCTCGERVGRERRERQLGPADPFRFLADAMLGSLAKWLRILGFDCAYEPDVADAELVERGVRERRVILTRDRALVEEWRVTDLHLLAAEDPEAQLREVVERFELAAHVRPFSRCSVCNTPLVDAGPEHVQEGVPPRIAATHSGFRRCPECERVYWRGSHADRMARVLGDLLGGE
jgi:uncharacterized protein with PIN domain